MPNTHLKNLYSSIKNELNPTNLSDIYTYSKEVLMRQKGDFTTSDFVREKVGADNVCERSLMAFGCERIIMKKRAENGMTLAIGAIRRESGYE